METLKSPFEINWPLGAQQIHVVCEMIIFKWTHCVWPDGPRCQPGPPPPLSSLFNNHFTNLHGFTGLLNQIAKYWERIDGQLFLASSKNFKFCEIQALKWTHCVWPDGPRCRPGPPPPLSSLFNGPSCRNGSCWCWPLSLTLFNESSERDRPGTEKRRRWITFNKLSN